MGVGGDPIREHDVVALHERVGTWPAGTSGTVVGFYDGAALVEVAEDDPPGSALDNLLTVPFEELELRWSHRTGWVDGMEA
jgi:hypothetical protein